MKYWNMEYSDAEYSKKAENEHICGSAQGTCRGFLVCGGGTLRQCVGKRSLGRGAEDFGDQMLCNSLIRCCSSPNFSETQDLTAIYEPKSESIDTQINIDR